MKKKIILTICLLFAILLPALALAEGIQFKPSMNIPGFGSDTITVDGTTLAKYIRAVYRYGGIFAGAVAMFMLVYAGWEWLLAGGNSSKISRARDKINSTLIGLALLFGGYILLSLISKDLVNFKPLNTALPKIGEICPTLTDEKTCTRSGCLWVPTTAEEYRTTNITHHCVAPLSVSCPSEGQLQDIAIPRLNESCSDCRLTIDTINKLKIAVNMLDPNTESMTITSAYRTLEKQQELYDCYKNRTDENNCPSGCSSCNEAAKPSCEAPHMTGTAVDVCIRTATINSCSYMSSKYNCENKDSCPAGLYDAQQTLKSVMEGAGFVGYDKEWWHFQAQQGS